MRDVRVIILAGGYGTRLRPFTLTLPKAAVPAINRPAISYAMDLVCRSGITDVGILYAEDILRDIAEQLWGRQLTLHWLRDDERTGTGSALRAVPPAWRDGEIVILPGDIANDVDLVAMHREHLLHRADLSLACSPVPGHLWDGDVLDLDPTGRVTRYAYLPPPCSHRVHGSCGVHVVSPGPFWDLITTGGPLHLSAEVFPAAVDNDLAVHAFPAPLPPHDFGLPQEILAGTRLLFDGRLPGPTQLAPAPHHHHRGLWAAPSASIDPRAQITGPVLIGAEAHVGPRAVVHGPACIGQQARVHRDAFVEHAVVMPGATVPADTYLGHGLTGDPTRLRDVVTDLAARLPAALLTWPPPRPDGRALPAAADQARERT